MAEFQAEGGDAPGAWAKNPRCRCCSSAICSLAEEQNAKELFDTDGFEQLEGLFDTHNHMHQSGTTAETLDRSGLFGCTVLAVAEFEWSTVLSIATEKQSTILVPGIGIHPWYVHEAHDGWDDRMIELLRANPAAIVGEIGLCKCA